MLHLRFKDDGNDLVATLPATFDMYVIDMNRLLKKRAAEHFNKGLL